MSLQKGTFEPLPPKEELRRWVEEHRRHNADVTSYLWHVIPVAERFGERAYDIAARSLCENGLTVTGTQLDALGGDGHSDQILGGVRRTPDHADNHPPPSWRPARVTAAAWCSLR